MSETNQTPDHPGAIIKARYLTPQSMSSAEASKRLDVHPSTFGRLVNGKSDITPEMALKLELVFGLAAEQWLALQAKYDLAKARRTTDQTKLAGSANAAPLAQ